MSLHEVSRVRLEQAESTSVGSGELGRVEGRVEEGGVGGAVESAERGDHELINKK